MEARIVFAFSGTENVFGMDGFFEGAAFDEKSGDSMINILTIHGI